MPPTRQDIEYTYELNDTHAFAGYSIERIYVKMGSVRLWKQYNYHISFKFCKKPLQSDEDVSRLQLTLTKHFEKQRSTLTAKGNVYDIGLRQGGIQLITNGDDSLTAKFTCTVVKRCSFYRDYKERRFQSF